MKNKPFIEKIKEDEIKSLAEEIAKEVQKGLAKLTLISPYKLSELEIDLILKSLPFIFLSGVSIENLIDNSLIAGVVIMYHSRVIDLSLKKRLENLQRELIRGL